MCDLIVRDEAPMQHRRCFQLVDRMLQDLRSSTARFGGLTVVLTVIACANRRRLHHGMLASGGKLRGCISWQILNGSVRWSDRRVGRSLASWNADFWGEVEMDNSKNTDSCTTSRRSEDQQQHCQWERPERERSGPVRSHTVLRRTLPLPHQHRRIILLPEDLGHINCGDSGKGSK
ncbi:BQ5605_C006g04003 [Microbotryum silenes-dioicae]|uniref:ATP-dependent DNA helicase n=1 Tax=Microbotryum silenes-dioicae TaxID=796604 RepID=A0A2X0M9V4_9BASI|nr:BQ5605_C006g04003 [Microbotryum silenes-dioicae]